ncbi:MAG: DEAD/DEAH box helicase [Selenomonadaceae bacterium]|nr:DEAD/DEAH box helicase [Selenomonadaceae bacterium]
MTALEKILESYRNTSENEIEKGKKFEVLMKNFLPLNYRGEIEKVMLWQEFSNEKDLGIDLVAKTYSGEFWAIQCKFYAENTTIEKAAVDSFISNSGRTFNGKKFSLRIFISTSDNFTDNAAKMFENQTPPVIQIGMEDLRNAAVDWEKLDAGEFVRFSRNLREYQVEALDAAHEHFQTHERGKLIMACGTGKTFTSLRIAEDLTQNCGLVLFLVPSLSLVKQTLNEWTDFSADAIRAICVCSDETVANNDDPIKNVMLKIPVTNQPEEISAAVNRKGNFGMTVIFSTYQSIENVIDAKLNFDLVICDEAHRTAGFGKKDKIFSQVHDNKKIISKRRLYMTATPKLFTSEAKKSAPDKNLNIWSMDDENIFGKEFFRISFRKAIDKGCLSPYKVLVFTIHEQLLPPALKKLILEKGSAISTDDALKIAGCISTLSKRSRRYSEKLKDEDPGFMHKAVAFCQSIKASKDYAEKYSRIQEKFFEDMTPEQKSNFVNIEITHIDGTNFNAKDREEILHNLATNTDGNLCKIVSNVRCLSEGVDVPSLDAVIFLSPKRSQIEIVQAVGRALRISKDKNYGYIIIPVIIPMDKDPDTALAGSDFKEIWHVLNAIRSHDDKFDIYIQQIKMRLESNSPKPPIDDDSPIIVDAPADDFQLTLDFDFEDWAYKIYARMVDSVGDRHYWWHWAQNIAEIVKNHTQYINEMIAQKDSPQAAAFKNFLDDLHKIINPSITEQEAVDMLAQHLITRPVFKALFENESFVQNNPVSKSMTEILYQLDKTGLENDRAKLKEFYDDVKESCRNMGDDSQRQDIIRRLYDNFFRIALEKTVQKLGIVYTPVEVVDFILNSVNDVLQKEFHRSISDENVHILDPFTGTGTFITRLIQSGLIQPKDLLRKYQYELHANEIVLLAYYIAAINIENSFHSVAATDEYQNFNGICLTDTFQSYENAENKNIYLSNFENPLRENSALIKKQLDTKIEIIVGNPPYSVGQKSANDNAQNTSYKKLEKRIADTYAAGTAATNKNSLYDSYIKAFRWASDRIDGGGIIAFVTNAGWLDGAAMDGLRNCFANEFSSIYVFNLRGNARTQGEVRRKEAGNIFDSGSRAPIAITILVKNPAETTPAQIFYCDIGDYLSRDEKLAKIKNLKTVLTDDFKIIVPNEKGDWINQRGNDFETFLPLAPDKKFDAAAQSFFVVNSNGLNTNRDSWSFNFSKTELEKNIQSTIDFYNNNTSENIDSTKIIWTRATKQNKQRGTKYKFDANKIFETMYRPFCKQNFYYDKNLIEMMYQMKKIFPIGNEENLLICVQSGENKNISVFIVDKIFERQFQFNGQCFPLYWYKVADKGGNIQLAGMETYTRQDGVTDFILNQARLMYGDAVTKEDIFYYVYGFLHLPSYREKFSADLKKSLPRIFLVNEPRKFWQLAKAGRELAEIHLNYERQPAANVEVIQTGENYRVEKLRLSKDKTALIYNEFITIKNIPARAFEYVVNGRSPLEWIIDRYQIKTDKASGITNNPNDWCDEHNKPRYILDLILSCITVSLKTLDIVENLPSVDF